MRFFSRRRRSIDSRRRQVRPELELLESRIVPSSGNVSQVYPVGYLVAPIAQGQATSGFQGGLGGGAQAYGFGPSLAQLQAQLQADAEEFGSFGGGFGPLPEVLLEEAAAKDFGSFYGGFGGVIPNNALLNLIKDVVYYPYAYPSYSQSLQVSSQGNLNGG
jgi:hypothetical protein